MKIAVYGSLRKDEYNYNRFVSYFKDGLEYIKTTVIGGFDLFDLGSYPGIKVSEDPRTELTVDVMECSERCFDNIEAMELGANYVSREVRIDGETCTIYVYKGNTRKENLVVSGDWSKYLKNEEVTA